MQKRERPNGECAQGQPAPDDIASVAGWVAAECARPRAQQARMLCMIETILQTARSEKPAFDAEIEVGRVGCPHPANWRGPVTARDRAPAKD